MEVKGEAGPAGKMLRLPLFTGWGPVNLFFLLPQSGEDNTVMSKREFEIGSKCLPIPHEEVPIAFVVITKIDIVNVSRFLVVRPLMETNELHASLRSVTRSYNRLPHPMLLRSLYRWVDCLWVRLRRSTLRLGGRNVGGGNKKSRRRARSRTLSLVNLKRLSGDTGSNLRLQVHKSERASLLAAFF